MKTKEKVRAHQRYKTKEGIVVPGVTTIIDSQSGWNKNALIAWARREALNGNDPDKIKEDAAYSGTLAHYLIECHIKGQEPDLSEYSPADIEKANHAYNAFCDWECQMDLRYVHSELQLVSEQYKYGGTIDIVARNSNGKLWLLDIKTSSGVYPEMKVQVSAYKEMYQECQGEQIEAVHIIKVSKDGEGFEDAFVPPQTLERAWEVFKHWLNLYRLQKEFK